MAARKPIYVLWKYTTSNGGDVRHEGEFKGFDAVNNYCVVKMQDFAQSLGDSWEFDWPTADNIGDCIEYTRDYHEWYYEFEARQPKTRKRRG